MRGPRPSMIRSILCPLLAVLLLLPLAGLAQERDDERQFPDWIGDCAELPECAPLLDPPTNVGRLGEEERAVEAAVRTALLLTGGYRPQEQLRRVHCVGEVTDAVRDALLERFPHILPGGECELMDASRVSRPEMVHRPTGRAAMSIRGDPGQPSGDRMTAMVSYYVGPLHAASWRCAFERRGEGWRPVDCEVTLIS